MTIGKPSDCNAEKRRGRFVFLEAFSGRVLIAAEFLSEISAGLLIEIAKANGASICLSIYGSKSSFLTLAAFSDS
jgi:hypothetical protein